MNASKFFSLRARSWIVGLALLPLTGCVVSETRPEPYTPAEQAQVEIPDARLLDIGVGVFETGLPDEGEATEEGVFRNVRQAEASYVAVQLKDTLQKTGHWGMVRVVPERSNSLDLHLKGEIVESDGEILVLEIKAVDATNRVWFKNRYKGRADGASYSDSSVLDRDPFQSLYNAVANDLLEHRERLATEDLQNVRQVAELRFAGSIAPAAFGEHLAEDRDGDLAVARLPAKDDPMLARVRLVRERDYMFIDTLNDHYGTFHRKMEEPYESWRKFSYEEILNLREVKRTARWQQMIGAAAVIGAVAMGAEADSRTAAVASDVALIGGIGIFRAGLQTAKEAKIHADVISELGESFNADIQPAVVEVQGEERRLTGSAATQYGEWQRLMQEIWTTETGLPATGSNTEVAATSESSEP